MLTHRLRVYRLFAVTLLAALLSSACGDDEVSAPVSGLAFPGGFLFGTSTAGFQVDMGCPTLADSECVDPHSDWYQFVTSPETVGDPGTFLAGTDPAEVGPGHWELYESDFDLAANELHSDAFRMSLEWSRIFPTSTEGVEGYEALRAIADDGALAHYHDVFAALRERGLTPFVTLHHYTLPVWMHDAVGCHVDLSSCSPRGWLEGERIIREIAKYAGFAAREFAGEVDFWATQNEPFAVVLPGYLQPTELRSNPPAVVLRQVEARQVFLNMIEAHARMVDAVREGDTTDADGDGRPTAVGIVYALAPFAPADPELQVDVRAAENLFYLWNAAFLDAVALGELDDDLDGNAEYQADLAGRMDYIGVNYYFRGTVAGTPGSILPQLSPLATFNPLSIESEELYPRGLYEVTSWAYQRYGLPLYVTENNGFRVPEGDVEGESEAMVEHLTWLHRAIEEGVDVRGWFYWSLIDNYEWNHGMDVPLGLYAVDPDDPDKRRVPRAIVDTYARIAASGVIADELLDRYPVSDPEH